LPATVISTARCRLVAGGQLEAVGFVRPNARCCSATDSRSDDARSWTHRIASTWLPPSPGLPGGTSATSPARRTGVVAVPSTKPVMSCAC
jgi:hypothetical protein